MKIGVVGATGVVGEVFLELLNERNFPVEELRLFASASSEGNKVSFREKEISLQVLKENCFEGLDLVFFSSGDEISKEWAPKAVSSGAFAVDNSAAFRMAEDTPLVVPEVNGHLLPEKNQPAIIANPNCSTIQLVVALNALKKFGLKSVKVASYQAASGAGRDAMKELKEQARQFLANEEVTHKEFSAPLAFNCIPQIGSIKDDGFCTEERKIIFESKKILELNDLDVSAFTVRIPTLVGHAEAAWVTLEDDLDTFQLEDAFLTAEGLVYHREDYPLVNQIAKKNPVHIGRLHRDICDPQTWLMWIVADNLRKGAALNGLQIAERIFDIS